MRSLLPAFVALSLLGCTNGSPEHDGGAAQSAGAGNASVNDADDSVSGDARTVAVACASCIYEMSGVSGCKLAAKIDGKPVLVTGVELDAHSSGLCSGAKEATVHGELRDQKFVATRIALK